MPRHLFYVAASPVCIMISAMLFENKTRGLQFLNQYFSLQFVSSNLIIRILCVLSRKRTMVTVYFSMNHLPSSLNVHAGQIADGVDGDQLFFHTLANCIGNARRVAVQVWQGVGQIDPVFIQLESFHIKRITNTFSNLKWLWLIVKSSVNSVN